MPRCVWVAGSHEIASERTGLGRLRGDAWPRHHAHVTRRLSVTLEDAHEEKPNDRFVVACGFVRSWPTA